MESGKVSKFIHLEVMRIIAIFFVIFNHTNSYGFFLFAEAPLGSTFYWLYMIPSIFCKFSVPLFFAISGALMLGKEESLGYIWKHRILKIFLLLFGWSVFYFAWDIHMGGAKLSLHDFFVRFYSLNMKVHLWYMCQYITYLAVLPLLRALVNKLEDKYYYYMIGIALFFSGILPTLEYLAFKGTLSINSNFKITWLLSQTVLFPCIGYFLQHKLTLAKTKKMLPYVWVANIIGIAISCFMTFYSMKISGDMTESNGQTFFKSFVLLNCIAIYTTTRCLFENRKMSDFFKKGILSVGQCTFGIYLIHIWIRYMPLWEKTTIKLQASRCNSMLAVLLMCIVILLISYIITWIISKIPFIRKSIGL